MILSPGYPGNYGNNLLCDYTIIAGDQRFILLTFDQNHFHIQGREDRNTQGNRPLLPGGPGPWGPYYAIDDLVDYDYYNYDSSYDFYYPGNYGQWS